METNIKLGAKQPLKGYMSLVVQDARHPLGLHVHVRVMQVLLKILKDGSFLFFCFCFSSCFCFFGKGNYTCALVPLAVKFWFASHGK